MHTSRVVQNVCVSVWVWVGVVGWCADVVVHITNKHTS